MSSLDQIWAPQLRGAQILFTTRHGGVSIGEKASLNLARHVDDDPESVERNRVIVAERIGVPLVFVDQVHSADVHVLPHTGPIPLVTADAMVTDRDDVALAIMVADCLPVLLADADAGVIAAAHAGRRGLLDGVLRATIEAMRSLGARTDRMGAVIGPSICGACYEVPAAMREESALILPMVRAETRWGSPSLDLRAGALEDLVRAGMGPERIEAAPPCTLEDPAYFSHRRSHAAGRFAGVIRRADTRPTRR